METAALPSTPAAAVSRAAARLECLGQPRFAGPGGTIVLGQRRAAEPVELLLRIVAAGPPGLAFSSLRAALWPRRSQRQCVARVRADAQALALLAGTESDPFQLDGDLLTVARDVLEVDSLVLEEALAPLVAPFGAALPNSARAALAHALCADPVFLPGFDAPWALAARLRIADKLARAARRLADGSPDADHRKESPT